jgi:hypothetical protein
VSDHEVIVGNVGIVYDGQSDMEASYSFNEYRAQSREGYGRAAGESVTWLRDGEIYKEYIGTQDNEEQDNG